MLIQQGPKTFLFLCGQNLRLMESGPGQNMMAIVCILMSLQYGFEVILPAKSSIHHYLNKIPKQLVDALKNYCQTVEKSVICTYRCQNRKSSYLRVIVLKSLEETEQAVRVLEIWIPRKCVTSLPFPVRGRSIEKSEQIVLMISKCYYINSSAHRDQSTTCRTAENDIHLNYELNCASKGGNPFCWREGKENSTPSFSSRFMQKLSCAGAWLHRSEVGAPSYRPNDASVWGERALFQPISPWTGVSYFHPSITQLNKHTPPPSSFTHTLLPSHRPLA